MPESKRMSDELHAAIERAAEIIANRIEASRVTPYGGADKKGFRSIITAELSPLFEERERRIASLEGLLDILETEMLHMEEPPRELIARITAALAAKGDPQ